MLKPYKTKTPIIDWEVYTEDSRMYWKIIKVGNHTEVYHIFEDMLKNFDKDDLVKLWSLVHERFNSTEPTEDKEIELWVEIKRLFNLLMMMSYGKREHDIFMLVEKDYPLTRGLMTLMLCNKLQVDQHSEMADELLRKIFILVNRPRQQHGRMILESVENCPLIWPSIEENKVTRPKKYYELSATKAIQVDCDIKATNIILQGLPPEVYALVKNHKVAKFSLLLNDMNIYNMKLEQFQVNTKFLNTLPPEWSKFVTDVKLVWDLHTTNIDQLHAYVGQHEFHANESPQYGSPYQSQQYSTHQSSTPLSISYPSNDYQSSIHHNIYSPSSSIPQLEYAPVVNQQPEFSQPDLDLIVLVFQKGNDPINAINHIMSFLTTVVTSCYPTTNNQPRNSSNPRKQATISDERVILQPIQGRQTSFDAGTIRTYTQGASRSNSGKQRTVICYNCKGKGHMCKQCTKPKRKWDDSWFKDKVLLVQAQANSQILHEEELAFLADP
ncbi:retrovirus-related pol polyprotein from transposon TNT 1-94 [Tanacetum coccineum]